MIVVNNTKELQANYNLDRISDSEQIMILGGLANKSKYNQERYNRRVTYNARDVKQIISEMEEIESAIPKNWNQWQKAKYIYEKLGERISYNFNKEEYASQQPSNLTILLSQKGICAGYSLLYKEMMDRQGIQCDYIRGTGVVSSTGHSEKHAWNVLNIDGYSVPVDLTWDAQRIGRGRPLEFFGDCKGNFKNEHIPDADEISYNLSSFTSESINGIETNPPNKEEIIEKAIKETYSKFKNLQDEQAALKQVKSAISDYILKGEAGKFTRDNYARQGIIDSVSKEDMLELVVQKYVQKIARAREGAGQERDILGQAVKDTLIRYGNAHTEFAITKYIKDADLSSFTRTNGARENIGRYVGIEQMVASISENIVKDIIYREREQLGETQQLNAVKKYFHASEFSEVEPPENVFSKAISWIKQKSTNREVKRQDNNVLGNNSKEER